MYRNPPQLVRDGTIPEQARPRGRMPIRADRIPLVSIGWFTSAVWWIVGARYTIDGIPLIINTLASFLHIPFHLTPIVDWRWYLSLCWLPVFFSIIEQRNRPRWGGAWSVIMVWVVVAGLDLVSTWLAVTTQPGDWRIAQQIATTSVLAALWTGVTTFIPERLMMSMWRLLRR